MTDAPPHPREVFDYFGGEASEAAFLDALERGRLHHAWLLTGPDGVGKATFAYRVARRLLGATPDASHGLLGATPADPVCRQIMARAHPDLLALQRDPEDGKTRKGIPVDEARDLPEFFAKSPASAPYRVAIIDTADDLGVSAANAVLKTLEEPPERGVLLLVSHSPGALLPTLRSRCRRLRFAPAPAEAVAAWVAEKSGEPIEDARRLTAMAGGAGGRAWRLATGGALAADETARELLDRLPGADEAAMVSLGDGFRGPSGADRFNLLFERLADQVHARSVARALAGEGGGHAKAWAEAWEMLIELPRRVEAVNLDRADAFFAALTRLRAIA